MVQGEKNREYKSISTFGFQSLIKSRPDVKSSHICEMNKKNNKSIFRLDEDDTGE